MSERLREDRALLLLSLQFLTRLPLPDPGYTPERMARTPRWHPGAGVVIGLIVALVWWVAASVFPPVLAILVSTVAGLLLTGCFHEDGFADACDGLGGGATRERALEIMRDSRLGTYGTAGLVGVLALKVAALAALPEGAVFWALVAGHAASRASSVLVLATSTYVRDHGTGKPVSDGIEPGDLTFALTTGGAACLPLILAAGLPAVIAGLLGLTLGHLGMRRLFERKLGGYTGDCLGAVQQCSEVAFYLGLLLWL
jgi:adenosylcobinamide-GDP ribazoletransferase